MGNGLSSGSDARKKGDTGFTKQDSGCFTPPASPHKLWERRAARCKAFVEASCSPRKHGSATGHKLNSGSQRKIMACLQNSLLWTHLLDEATQRRVASEMTERQVTAGTQLITAGEAGPFASQLFVVRSGKFEVLEERGGVLMRVNTRGPGEYFGEIGLLYDCPRSATVAASTDASVWVLERSVFRQHVRASAEEDYSQRLAFLNSVSLMTCLSLDQRAVLSSALVEEVHEAGTDVVVEGEVGDKFYLVKEGEAMVLAGHTVVNYLFKSDFFGEACLLSSLPRKATVRAHKHLKLLALDRATFVSVLGPLEEFLTSEKSPRAISQRMARLQPLSPAFRVRPTADVIIRSPGHEKWAVGHLDEVVELLDGGMKHVGLVGDNPCLVLIEGKVLGEGSFSRVVQVTEESTGRQFAMKQCLKSVCMKCPRHLFAEQQIGRDFIVHPFIMRQFASFKDADHLYFLTELMPGGDCMDVLIAESKVIKYAGFKMWQGMNEQLAQFYVGGVILALEHMHSKHIVYRDLKPENILRDAQGYPKLGDLGFAKRILPSARTFTFCGTPGYVSPETIIGRGYSHSVDYWTLGALIYVLITARQPFADPDTDAMEVMQRIVNENWRVLCPPFVSEAAKDLIIKLLERRPSRRLGMQRDGMQDIKQHPWFEGFDWDALATRRMQPPSVPKASSNTKQRQDLLKQSPPTTRAPLTAQELAAQEATFKNF